MAPNKAVGSWLSRRKTRGLNTTDTDEKGENVRLSSNITDSRQC